MNNRDDSGSCIVAAIWMLGLIGSIYAIAKGIL